MQKIEFYWNFFTTDNSSGKKTTEKWLSKNEPEIYNKVKTFIDDLNFDVTFKEGVWLFCKNITNKPRCKQCDKPIKFGRSLVEGFNDYCSVKCANKSEDHRNRVKQTNISKYGGNTPMSSPIIRQKVKNTTLEKYGVDNVMKLDEIKDKFKEGSIKKYGTDYPAQSKLFKKELLDKNLEKYSEFGLVYKNNNDFWINCDDCNITSELNSNLFYYRLNNNINLCTSCNPINTNNLENELISFIESLDVDYEIHNRDLIKPKELDILIPNKKIAIEFNGNYFHSELYKNKNYHYEKQIAVESEGYQLLQIFEDEWLNKPDIVKSIIKTKLGMNKRVYARKCVFKEITTKEARKFINTFHIQGYNNSKFKYGLFYEDTLISVMTFSSLRKSLGMNSIEGHYELNRFCTKEGFTIIGGASKLIKNFIKLENPIKITSFADRRYSIGNVYEKIGFEKTSETRPNYFYLVKGERKHRFNYAKHKLVTMGYSKSLSEHDIMLGLGYYRIYDCGNLKFEMNVNKC